jgi:hypothetical protein
MYNQTSLCKIKHLYSKTYVSVEVQLYLCLPSVLDGRSSEPRAQTDWLPNKFPKYPENVDPWGSADMVVKAVIPAFGAKLASEV